MSKTSEHVVSEFDLTLEWTWTGSLCSKVEYDPDHDPYCGERPSRAQWEEFVIFAKDHGLRLRPDYADLSDGSRGYERTD